MTFVGTAMVRGVPCNQWQVVFSRRNGTWTIAIQTYFAVDYWGYSNTNWGQKPMRAIINGTNSNGSMSFVSYLEFVNFVPTAPIPATWAIPMICLGIGGQIFGTLGTPAGKALATGMFFFGLFFGIIATGVSIWIYCKRRQSRFNQFNSQTESK